MAERVTINRDRHLHPGMWKLGPDWGARTELIKENDIGNEHCGKFGWVDEKGPPLTSRLLVWCGDIRRWRKLREDVRGHVSGLASQNGTLAENINHNGQCL